MANVRLFFETGILRVCPPWLRRTVGTAVMKSLGVQIDTEIDRDVDGVGLRFPNPNQPDALGFLGRERRILRGPAEPAANFAIRLRTWWDAHSTRGGPYALLGQMFPYLAGTIDAPVEVVGNSGIRHLVDANGVITRDSIDWNGDGNYPTKWARFWVMINSATLTLPLVTESGEPVLTESGEQVLTVSQITAANITDEQKEIVCAVPREWSAAHIDEVHVILLFDGGELWGYRTTTDPASGTTIGTWADTDPSPGQVWQSEDPADILC